MSDFDKAELNRNLHDCNALHNKVGTINPRNPGLLNGLIQFVKKVMRRSLSWYTRPLHQFHGAVTRTLNELSRAVEAVENDVENLNRLELSWRQTVPAFLNAISTVGAFGHELRKLRRETEQELQVLHHGLGQEMDQRLQVLHDGLGQEMGQRLQVLHDGLGQEIDQRLQSLHHGLGQEMDQRLQLLRHELGQEVEQEFQSVRRNLQQTSESVAATWARIEFTRSEILYEMKYGRRMSGGGTPEVESKGVEPKIVAPQKVAAASQLGLKLNLGCGHIPLDGYVNVDRRELAGVDVVAEVGDLPFEEGAVQEISSAHLLEHFPQELLRRRLLPFWRTLLMPGGTFRAVVPDGEAMLAGVAAGNYSFSDFREVLFGAQDYDGDFHFNLFTPASLCALLEEAGFKDTRVNARARRNGKCFEFEVCGIKPPLRG
jgi:hypothetical protein